MYDIEKNGFQVFKGVFSKTEIESFRKDIINKYLPKKRLEKSIKIFNNKKRNLEVTQCDNIDQTLFHHGYIVLNKKIINCVKELLGEEIIYFRDNSMHYGEGNRGFHKDNVSRNDLNHSDWQSNYNIVRMGLYLQDHKSHSGGLTVVDGSHKEVSIKNKKKIIVPLEIGDIIFWKLTTTHSGNTKKLKIFSNFAIPTILQRKLPNFIFQPEQKKRIAIFSSYGKQGIHLDTYMDFLREEFNNGQNNSPFNESVKQISKDLNIKLIDPFVRI